MFIYAWNEASKSAKALADALPARRIKHQNSRYQGRPDKTVINYGASQVPDEVLRSRIINPPQAVAVATNKRSCLQALSGVPGVRTVEFTTEPAKVLDWLADGEEVIARTILRGHSAEGLVIIDPDDPNIGEILKAPLFTKYKKKKAEYRIHVAGGEVFDIQQKKLRTEWDDGTPVNREEVDFRIRNHANGFVFCRENINCPEEAQANAVQAVVSIGLDFGAVDVIWNEHENRSYVLEINTAPGLEGTTIESYAAAIRRLAAVN